MLQALTRFFGGRSDPAQLPLPLDIAPGVRTADELLARLRELGLTTITGCHLTRNRNVMVSFRGSQLRVHEGFLAAPADVHEAIVTFIEGRTRAARRAARRRIVDYPIDTGRGPVRRVRTRPQDAALAARLTEWHARYNAEHFGGALRPVPVRVSRRMHSRLGHYTAGKHAEPGEITISWRHFRRHGWDEVLHTLLHEMVHQWQDETGHGIDHGPQFRRKAREVGIAPSAKRAPGYAAAREATG
jgi:hypothetical protein